MLVHLVLLNHGLKGTGGENLYSMLALFDRAAQLSPCGVAGDRRRARTLEKDQHTVSEAVPVKLGHGFQILLVRFAFKNLLDAVFQLVRQCLDPLLLLSLRVSVPGCCGFSHGLYYPLAWALPERTR